MDMLLKKKTARTVNADPNMKQKIENAFRHKTIQSHPAPPTDSNEGLKAGLAQYLEFEKNLLNLCLKCREYANTMETAFTVAVEIAATLQRLTSGASPAERIDRAEFLGKAMLEMKETVVRVLSLGLECKVVEPLLEEMQGFSDIKSVSAERNKALLDVQHYTRKVDDLSENTKTPKEKLERNREKLADAELMLTQKTQSLWDQFECAEQLRHRLLSLNMEGFMDVNRDLFSELYERSSQLSRTKKSMTSFDESDMIPSHRSFLATPLQIDTNPTPRLPPGLDVSHSQLDSVDLSDSNFSKLSDPGGLRASESGWSAAKAALEASPVPREYPVYKHAASIDCAPPLPGDPSLNKSDTHYRPRSVSSPEHSAQQRFERNIAEAAQEDHRSISSTDQKSSSAGNLLQAAKSNTSNISNVDELAMALAHADLASVEEKPKETAIPDVSPQLLAEPPPKGKVKLRALFDFEAIQQGDLSFKVGDIILIDDDKYAENSWIIGHTVDGKHGLFPTNYTELVS